MADYNKFYRRLFEPVEAKLGPIDADTLLAIVGFDAGGPLNFCTMGRGRGEPFVTYISCELAVRPNQKAAEFGRYELLASCDDEKWCRSVMSNIGRMTLEVSFGHGHTLDIGPWVKPQDRLQGVAFEKFAAVEIDGEKYGILRCIGITASELNYARKHGVPKLMEYLKEAGVYTNTSVHRQSVV